MMNKLLIAFTALFLLSGCTKGPTDDQLKTLLNEVHTQLMNKNQSFEKNDSIVANLLQSRSQDFDVMKTEGRQLPFFTEKNTFLRSTALKNWISPRLSELSGHRDKDGAIALFIEEVMNRGKNGYNCEGYSKLLQHPGTPALLQDDSLQLGVFMLFMHIDREAAEKAALIKAALPLINSNLSVQNTLQSLYVFDAATDLNDALSPEEKENLRKAVLTQYERILTTQSDEKQKTRIQDKIVYLNSLYAQGKLIGSDAPELDFNWVSKGKAQKLSDYKGKVVVVDFWATWCGPCVGSFPNIRELQKRYKGYPVEIIGVTSLQGRHIDRSSGKPQFIDTEGNPQKEYNLMKDFMKNMDMTWTVAFSDQKVFNPEYGVNGIPHVAIIDPQGKVRYNVLRPYEAPYHEAEKIDALLQEAGLKYPEQPMEQTNFAQ